MARVMWKGAISFGLLHAPVSLYPAIQQDEIDFDWLKRDTLQAVGYKRVVKDTGKEVDKDDIIKAVKYEGRYVVLSDEEIKAANVKSTHTIDIVGFTDAEDVNFLFFETPYYLAPTKGGEKVYALLREALRKSKKIGIALVVLHNKQHLAALIATPEAIVLNTLRWATEVRSTEALDLPEEGLKDVEVKPKELTMATQLIASMTEDWDPTQYHDTFRDDIMAMVKKKYDEGMAEQVTDVKIEESETADSETDLTELLRQSLQGTANRSRRSGLPKKVPPPAARKTASRSRPSKSVH
ncbi:Ku protein [Herbaspirillum sp. GCM10030257]|uniref:non-homologous end joining protein Ku n=1 Tax=Herbaspirillum sp. GCM10030257 TaxID=3273393 RepID=UPI00361BAD11